MFALTQVNFLNQFYEDILIELNHLETAVNNYLKEKSAYSKKIPPENQHF